MFNLELLVTQGTGSAFGLIFRGFPSRVKS